MKIQNAFRFGLIGTLGVGLGLLILMSIVTLSTILTYIGAALFIALGIEPLISFLERRKFPRWAALVVRAGHHHRSVRRADLGDRARSPSARPRSSSRAS